MARAAHQAARPGTKDVAESIRTIESILVEKGAERAAATRRRSCRGLSLKAGKGNGGPTNRRTPGRRVVVACTPASKVIGLADRSPVN
jgi:hypothetical protein